MNSKAPPKKRLRTETRLMIEYPNFAALKQDEREGVDFDIVCRPTRSPAAVIAPHGGEIEPGTSEIAAAIADDEFNLYCFEGRKPKGNTALHITSSNFDEPKCLDLISSCDRVVAVHGCRKGKRTAFLGGRDAELRDAIRDRLEASGFRTAQAANADLQGVSSRNICNKGRRGCGAQLEISRDLRDELKHDSEKLVVFAAAIRAAITRL
jgi:phage replication-related protein YjqB (UPF0714/DUF867 family)